MLEHAADDGHLPRAFLRIGGLSVARQQLALALTLECERVICIAPALTPELVALQHIAEGAGAQFNVVRGARALAGLVTASDELIALADGLFASGAEAADLLSEGQGVLVQPIEQGLAAGFERIDINHAAAGAMRIPGRLIERIADLPPDCDAFSSLQRVALQASIRQRAIPAAGQDGLFWTLVHSESEAHSIEPQWIRQRTRDTRPLGPARGLALLAVRSFGPALLHAGSGAKALTVAAAAAALLALGAGWLGFAALGLAFCALGWLLRESAVLVARIESELVKPKFGLGSLALYGWALDAIIVALLGWSTVPKAGLAAVHHFFPPFMLVALLRIVAGLPTGRWSGWLADRSLLALVMLGAVAGGIAGEAAHIGAAVAALAGMALVSGATRLTRP